MKILEYDASGGKEYFLEIVNDEDVLFGLLRLRIFDDESDLSNSHQLATPLALGLSREVARPLTHKLGSLHSLSNIDKSLTLSTSEKSSELSERGKLKNKMAIVRELHVYGQALRLKQKAGNASQHKGFGKWLMDEAEKITKQQGIDKLTVISGVGVRQYYRKLGYKLKGFYMVKKM